MKEKIAQLFEKIQGVFSCDSEDCRLPENTFFLDDGEILCLPRRNGDSRYPYGVDGFYLWAYQSGYFTSNESSFTIFPLSEEGKRPYLAFFFGEKTGVNAYHPVSFTGAAIQPREEVRRYTVYTPAAAYYLAETEKFRLGLRITVNGEKRIECTLYAENRGVEDAEIYFSTYMNCLLRFAPIEDVETKWFKSCRAVDNGFVFNSTIDLSRDKHVEYYGVVNRLIKGNITKISQTTAHNDFAGGKSVPLNCAESLFVGSFRDNRKTCRFTDTAIAGEIICMHLPVGESCEENISLRITSDEKQAIHWQAEKIAEKEFDLTVKKFERSDREKQLSENALRMKFGRFEEGIYGNKTLNGRIFERFIENVIRQVESCALAKTSSVSMLGIRDVFQQIESALIWNRKDCRKKIIEALNFIGVDGRVPRQYSLPAGEDDVPLLDLRAFIDQGVWIIDTLYTYLAYTGDASILDEVCGYYIYEGNTAKRTGEKDSVLMHLVRIVDYLLRNVDEETGCLKILYGDWNDALDGLGVSLDGSAEFGSGVSVMASLQFCKNLREFSEILRAYNRMPEKISDYEKAYERLRNGLLHFAVVKNGKGDKKIVHGWGDKQSYFVGSFSDSDGKARDGLAANAYWVIADAYSWDRSLKPYILDSFARLDSKYGLKTFEPYFERGTKGVGRIPNLPKGTAENGATYVHATLFGVWALFLMGEGKLAWEQLFKVLPQTHEHISTSPFIMSNSYVYNEEFGMDGESMNDWYTGSATVLLKVLIRCVFGIGVTLSELKIVPSEYFPVDHAEMRIKIRDCALWIEYRRGTGKSERTFYVDGERMSEVCLPLSKLGKSKHIIIEDR